MRFRYSPKSDALRLELADRPCSRSQRIGHGVTADLDATGDPVAVTVEQWTAPPHPLTGDGSPWRAADREAWVEVARQLEAADPFATRPR